MGWCRTASAKTIDYPANQALIIHREFGARSFALLIGLLTAIGQFTFAFGSGLFGVLRDAFCGYQLPLEICAAVEALAAVIVLVRETILDAT